MHARLLGAALAALCLIAPAAAQDQRYPGWHNRMTGYVEAKEPRWAVASWYDCRKPGQCSKSKRTANGERFNPGAMTAAHKSLPFGTRLKVCHSGCVQIRINDRGPFVRGRSLDLSAAAARAIRCAGVCRVTMARS